MTIEEEKLIVSPIPVSRPKVAGIEGNKSHLSLT